jgi:hypothetical protein
VALQATKEEVGSAERLIAYMERLAHPQGIEIPASPGHRPVAAS